MERVSFIGLPEDILEAVCSYLSASELGNLACASKALSKTVGRCGLWEEQCKRRWPLSCFSRPGVPAGARYSSHYQLYCKRMAQGSSFTDTVDMLHIVSAAARQKMTGSKTKKGPELTPSKKQPSPVTLRSFQSMEVLMTEMLKLANAVHAIVAKRPDLKQSKEYRVVSMDVSWWIEEQAQALLQHARRGERVKSMLAICSPGMVHQSVYDRFTRECVV